MSNACIVEFFGVLIMSKKVDKLRRLVAKLSARYGDGDADVLRLQSDLDALEVLTGARQAKEPGGNKKSFDFRSASRRLYSDSCGSGSPH